MSEIPEDSCSTDSAKENLRGFLTPAAKRKSKLEELTPKSRSAEKNSTSFNPFGKYQILINSDKFQFEKAVKNFKKSIEEEPYTDDGKKFLKTRPEAKQLIIELKKFVSNVKTVSKSMTTAVPSILTSFAPNFVGLCELFEKDETKCVDVMAICQKISEAVNAISSSVSEPFGSDLLDEWTPLLIALLSSPHASLRNSAINLWKCTFSKVTGKLRYSNPKLREMLLAVPKKHKLNVPEDISAENKTSVFDEDEEEVAMDCTEIGDNKEVKSGDTGFPQESSSFELSQQSAVDNLAKKLIVEKANENMKKTESPRSKNAEKFLLDEDTSEFVVIKTPISNQKNKLTDHQKEKFEESRDGLNYFNEESQSGTQRNSSIKTALKSLNFDVGTESCSSSDVVKQKDEEKEEKVDSTEITEPTSTKRASLKRPRRLFISEDNGRLSPSLKKTRSQKMDVRQDSTDDDIALINLPELESASKKKVPEESVSTRPKRYSRNLRSSSRAETGINIPEKHTDPEPERTEGNQEELTTATQVSVSEEKTVIEEEESTKEPTPQPITETQRDSQDSLPSTVELEEKEGTINVPQTPSTKKSPATIGTPSILRKTPGRNTPLTERRRNRVHFDADCHSDSLKVSPLKSSCSPKKSSKFVDLNPEPEPARTIADLPTSGYELENSAIYPSLVNCSHPISEIIRKLVPLSGAVTAISMLKKWIEDHEITTIGQFAKLTLKEIHVANGIRAPRDKTVRKVLSEYEVNLKKKKPQPKVAKVDDSWSMDSETNRQESEPKAVQKEELRETLETVVVEVPQPQPKIETIVEKVEKTPEKTTSPQKLLPSTKQEIFEAFHNSPTEVENVGIVESQPIFSEETGTSIVNDMSKALQDSPMKGDDAEIVETPSSVDMISVPSSNETSNNNRVTASSIENFTKIMETQLKTISREDVDPSEIVKASLMVDKMTKALTKILAKRRLPEEHLNDIDDHLYDTNIRLAGFLQSRGFRNQHNNN
ncbi:unnamed protein product [Caenorhabditis bovis]|uniref:Uncharacterized protein n=1 Tax=Caenorhabditis bovis TaxID=2654633 RepID=A0A8S1FDL3_9PELO|nr:unnamed protein product [Caenorhabditis bovis]